MNPANIERKRDLIAAALIWKAEGISTVPTEPRSKVCRLHWRQFEEKPPADNQIMQWFYQTGLENIAAVCGSGGLMVLDFDQVEQYTAWKSRAGELGETYTETTGRGLHCFFISDQAVNRQFLEAEVLGTRHLVTVSPSIHPTGAKYAALGDPCTPIIKAPAAAIFATLTAGPKGEGEALSKKELPPGAAFGPRDDLVSRIKANMSLLEYAESLTRMQPSGGGFYLGKCPLHEDNHPSFWVNSSKGIYGCFVSGCPGNRGGDVLNLYAINNDLTVKQAISELAYELRV